MDILQVVLSKNGHKTMVSKTNASAPAMPIGVSWVMGVGKELQLKTRENFFERGGVGGGGLSNNHEMGWMLGRDEDDFCNQWSCVSLDKGIMVCFFVLSGQIRSSALQQIILDEADTLLDDSFVDTVDRILHRLKVFLLSIMECTC